MVLLLVTLGMICLLFERSLVFKFRIYTDFSNASDAPEDSKSFRPLPSSDDFFGSNSPSMDRALTLHFLAFTRSYPCLPRFKILVRCKFFVEVLDIPFHHYDHSCRTIMSYSHHRTY